MNPTCPIGSTCRTALGRWLLSNRGSGYENHESHAAMLDWMGQVPRHRSVID